MTFKRNLNQFFVNKNFQCILFLNLSFDDGVFFNFNFDITMTYFLNPQFSFYSCDKHSAIVSKVHYESIFFLKFIHIFKYDSH
jgi:hypothetical protein